MRSPGRTFRSGPGSKELVVYLKKRNLSRGCGYAFGATTIYLPYIVRAPNAQFTRVSVLNTDTDAAQIQIQYINRDGVTDFTTTDTIDGLGSKTYAMNVPGGKVPNLMTFPYAVANGNWTGGLKITSLNGKEIAAVGEQLEMLDCVAP